MGRGRAVMIRTIEHIQRLRASVNGNPRFRIYFTDGPPVTTMSDAMFIYAVGNAGMREGCTVNVVLTRAGRISHMEPAEEPSMDTCSECGCLTREVDPTPCEACRQIGDTP